MAYNFLISADGTVHEGRGWELVGAHTYAWNSNSIGVAFLGDYRARLISKAARAAFINRLVDQGIAMVGPDMR